MEPTIQTIKRLFALSGNVCAYPKCEIPIVEGAGTVTGEICHIRARSKDFARFDLTQNDDDRRSFDNLILMCRHHHKIIDSQPDVYTVELLLELKSAHEVASGRLTEESDTFFAKMLINDLANIEVNQNSGNLAINSPGSMLAHTINIRNQGKTTKINPPPGSIGSCTESTGYVEYLIKRYIDFASVGKPDFHPGRFRINLERKFKSHYRLLPLEKSEILQDYLKEKIDSTILGKNKKAKGERSFSSFDEWRMR